MNTGLRRARSLARIGRRPAEPVVRGSNPRGPAIYIKSLIGLHDATH